LKDVEMVAGVTLLIEQIALLTPKSTAAKETASKKPQNQSNLVSANLLSVCAQTRVSCTVA
jgi:hypothetical protein